MDRTESTLPAQRQHHFLFHIFRMDKAEHPMPEHRAVRLLSRLKQPVPQKSNTENGRI